jgi:hypothetical protein
MKAHTVPRTAAVIMHFPSAPDAFDDGRPDEPEVVLRLCLMAPDEASGEPKFISSFLRRTSMPLALASPNVNVAVEIHGERRVFKPTQVTWDDARGVCIVEIVWLLADAASYADALDEAEPWPV